MPSYDHEQLWAKAKLFLNRAMDAEPPRDYSEQAFWASAALELLAKSALARVSPLLVATPSEDGVNLLIATGLVPSDDPSFQTIPAKTLWARCHRAFKPFNENEAKLISNGRNEYLHGGGTGFDKIPPEAWWPRFWAQVVVLLDALDRSIEDLVGFSRVAIVERHLTTRQRFLEERLEALVSRAKQRLAQKDSGNLTARLEREFNDPRPLALGLHYSTTADCLACGSVGELEGDEVFYREVRWEQEGSAQSDPWEPPDAHPVVILSIAAVYFSCPNCRLVLDTPELVDQAGLDNGFEVEGDIDDMDIDYEYGND